MSSLMTNVSAMTALKSLQQTNSALETTQSRIATGFRVAEASDNAAYWSIATTMRSDNKALGTVQDALGLGAAKVDVAYTGVNSAIEVVDEIKSKLVAAREPGVDRAKVQAEISELQNQLTSIASSAGFNGENWLNVDSSVAGYSATESIVASFDRDAAGAVSVGTISVDKSTTALFDGNAAATGILDTEFTTTGAGAVTVTVANLDLTAANVDETDIDDMISGVETALQSMTTAASDLGSAKKRIDLQSNFVGNLMDAVDRGIGQLVDADMSAESSRLSALQVQQQLGIQAMSIANGNSQAILSLFR
ncbi:MAG: flagellin [Roseitalea sp.]|jgi:flagellin|uniref:Flagellin n=1 Tax=Oceaniradius stylonematis TaxID=2184161 RepID=A0A3A8AKL8_9HYPH|nr:flagellin [Oceaniradius stylonematis]MBO6553132.1 flagellin [Roseitalea sp.]MBO6951108.1 flagellin [Rhizobiaceae bacterium]RNC93860.1 MAG: flagellin [Oricola sp.]MBO6590905.1 flagellin [Roseitalea sp.]MBO6599837.1 flagellin [Roseitalea sp.]